MDNQDIDHLLVNVQKIKPKSTEAKDIKDGCIDGSVKRILKMIETTSACFTTIDQRVLANRLLQVVHDFKNETQSKNLF